MLLGGPGDNLQLNMTVLHEHASVAQWIAHRFSTPMVAGSNPAGGTDRLRKIHGLWESLVNPPGWGPGKSRVQIAPARPPVRASLSRNAMYGGEVDESVIDSRVAGRYRPYRGGWCD